MIEVFDCAQGTPEWRECRRGIPTASAFHAILAKGEGKTRRKYMLELLGEQLTGMPAESFSNAHTERGHTMEAEVREMLWMDYAEPFRTVGFIRRTIAGGAGAVGCSPDSLVGEDGLLEIKSKLPHLQLEVLLKKQLPPEHVAQCQGALWVTGRKWLDFISYWPGLPLFRLRVEPDLEYFEKLQLAVGAFLLEMEELRKELPTGGVLPVKNDPNTTFDSLDGESRHG